MKTQELRSLSKEELLQKEKSLKDELYKLNMQRYGGRVEKPHMFSLIKKDITRIKTILNEKAQINADIINPRISADKKSATIRV
jgi:large subunit ribosomal protein L29